MIFFNKFLWDTLKYSFKLPFSNPKEYFLLLITLPFLVLIFALPIFLLGVVFGLGIQLSLYIIYLWNLASNDAKLATVVALVIGILTLPAFIQSMFKFYKFLKK